MGMEVSQNMTLDDNYEGGGVQKYHDTFVSTVQTWPALVVVGDVNPIISSLYSDDKGQEIHQR